MPVTLRIPDGASLLLEVSAFTVDHNGDVNNIISCLYPWGSAEAAERVEVCQTALEGSRIVYKAGVWHAGAEQPGSEGPASGQVSQARAARGRGSRSSKEAARRRAVRNLMAAAEIAQDLWIEQLKSSPEGVGAASSAAGEAGRPGAGARAFRALARAQLRVIVAGEENGIYSVASKGEVRDIQLSPKQLAHFVGFRTHSYSLMDVATASEVPLFYLQQSGRFLHVSVRDLQVGAFEKDTRSVVPGAVSCVRVISRGDLQIIASLKVLARRSQLPRLLLPYTFRTHRAGLPATVYRQHPLIEHCRMPKPEGADLIPAPRGEVNALLTGALTLDVIENFPFSGRFFLELDFHLGIGWRVKAEEGDWMGSGEVHRGEKFTASSVPVSPGSAVPEIVEINADLNVAMIGAQEDRPYWYYQRVISQREPISWSVTSQIFRAKKGKAVHVSIPVIDIQKCLGMLYLPAAVPLCSPGYVTATLFRIGKAGTVYHTAASSILQLPQGPGAYSLSAAMIVPRYKNYQTIERSFYGYSAIGTGVDYVSTNASKGARDLEGQSAPNPLIRAPSLLSSAAVASSVHGMGLLSPLSGTLGRLGTSVGPLGGVSARGQSSAGGMAAALGQFSRSTLKFARTLAYALTGFFSIEKKCYLRFQWLACHCVPRNIVTAARLRRAATTSMDLLSSMYLSRGGLPAQGGPAGRSASSAGAGGK